MFHRAERRMREQIRILQNQNRFLNEEVKKLARLLQNERQKFKEQDKYVTCYVTSYSSLYTPIVR